MIGLQLDYSLQKGKITFKRDQSVYHICEICSLPENSLHAYLPLALILTILTLLKQTLSFAQKDKIIKIKISGQHTIESKEIKKSMNEKWIVSGKSLIQMKVRQLLWSNEKKSTMLYISCSNLCREKGLPFLYSNQIGYQ